MSNPNMALWDSAFKTDPAFTKQFKRAGGFSGTATSPIYLIRRATETFGPIGIGWGFAEIESKIAEEVWHSKVELWYKYGDARGVVQQWGATTFVNYRKKKDSRGNVLLDASGNEVTERTVDEEAAKKSVTDGVTKCLSYIGFAADIHMGLFDDSKYLDERWKEHDEQAGKKAAAPPKTEPKAAAKPAQSGEKRAWVPVIEAFADTLGKDTYAEVLKKCGYSSAPAIELRDEGLRVHAAMKIAAVTPKAGAVA